MSMWSHPWLRHPPPQRHCHCDLRIADHVKGPPSLCSPDLFNESVSISIQMHPLHHRPHIGSYIYTDTALTLLPWQRQDQKYFGLLKLRFRVILTKIHFLELWIFGVIDSSYYSWIHSHLMEEWLSILFQYLSSFKLFWTFFYNESHHLSIDVSNPMWSHPWLHPRTRRHSGCSWQDQRRRSQQLRSW